MNYSCSLKHDTNQPRMLMIGCFIFIKVGKIRKMKEPSKCVLTSLILMLVFVPSKSWINSFSWSRLDSSKVIKAGYHLTFFKSSVNRTLEFWITEYQYSYKHDTLQNPVSFNNIKCLDGVQCFFKFLDPALKTWDFCSCRCLDTWQLTELWSPTFELQNDSAHSCHKRRCLLFRPLEGVLEFCTRHSPVTHLRITPCTPYSPIYHCWMWFSTYLLL